VKEGKILSARQKEWVLPAALPAAALAQLGPRPILAALLYARGLHDAEARDHFFNSHYPQGLHDPFLLKGMDIAAPRVARAIAEKEALAVYGDFDTDGVTAVTLLMQAIQALGGQIRPYIPHRLREGYGLNLEAVEQLAQEGVKLLITVDCGITNVAEVSRAQALGMDVIVTDHHQPPPLLPPAFAVIDPKQPGCQYPYKQLVGVGIAYKLVQALVKQGMRLNLRGRDLLDMVALGTVADMGPLQGENRVLVKAGLEALNQTQRPGLQALIKVAGLKLGQIDSTEISFMLGPRLNAAGRLDDADLAYKLLLAPDLATAEKLAKELDSLNKQRQKLTKEIFTAIQSNVPRENWQNQRIVILDAEEYPAGIVGLVASKLVELWGRPVVLVERGPEMSRGSARSVSGCNLFAILDECRELFSRFGGHSAAAGFSLDTAKLPALKERLQTLAATQIADNLLIPKLLIDALLPLSAVNNELYTELVQFEPFGQANFQPTFMTEKVTVEKVRTMGADKQHLRLTVRQNDSNSIEAVAFDLGHLADTLLKAQVIDLAYALEMNEWNGESSLQLRVKDVRWAS